MARVTSSLRSRYAVVWEPWRCAIAAEVRSGKEPWSCKREQLVKCRLPRHLPGSRQSNHVDKRLLTSCCVVFPRYTRVTLVLDSRSPSLPSLGFHTSASTAARCRHEAWFLPSPPHQHVRATDGRGRHWERDRSTTRGAACLAD
jgi:hypothetical protein